MAQLVVRRRREISLDEAKSRGASLGNGVKLPRTVAELEKRKQRHFLRLERAGLQVTPASYGMLAVWQSTPLELSLIWSG